jgi:GntR family transcriptional repressor for pyruvate dehydrogenase complex
MKRLEARVSAGTSEDREDQPPLLRTGSTASITTATEQLAERLTQRITSGVYAPGSRLPGERELAEQFDVSRATVRSALQVLASRGIITIRNRSGAYVQVPSAGRVSQSLLHLISCGTLPVTVRDLIEIRRVFEVEMAGLAAERRTQEDLREIGRALADTASADQVNTWAEADVAFHGALARATHNPLFALIYDALRDVLLEQRLRTGTALPATRARSFRYHQRIYDRVYAGDGVGARKAMQEHLREAQETMLRYVVKLEDNLHAVPLQQEKEREPISLEGSSGSDR